MRVDVPGLRDADDRVQQHARIEIAGRPHGELLMSSVHRVARLEGHDPLPSALRQEGTDLTGRVAQRPECLVGGQPQHLQPTAHVPGMAVVQQRVHAGVRRVGGPEDGLRFGPPVRAPGTPQPQDRDVLPPGPQGQPPGRGRDPDDPLRQVERHRDRPQLAAGQAHRVADRLVVGSVEKGAQRREGARGQQFQVAALAARQLPGRQPLRRSRHLHRSSVPQTEIDERPAVRRRSGGCHGVSGQ